MVGSQNQRRWIDLILGESQKEILHSSTNVGGFGEEKGAIWSEAIYNSYGSNKREMGCKTLEAGGVFEKWRIQLRTMVASLL